MELLSKYWLFNYDETSIEMMNIQSKQSKFVQSGDKSGDKSADYSSHNKIEDKLLFSK